MSFEYLDKFINNKVEVEDQWISLSDIMAGLMMVFLLIAIVYMLKVQEIANNIKLMESELYKDLEKEFKNDFANWNVDLDSLTIRFKEPRVLFEGGKDKLKFRFKRILNKFVPRYLKIVHSKKYSNVISEIRIEGHTSSDYFNLSSEEAYIANMELSQNRAKNTLFYIFSFIPEIDRDKEWLRKKIAAIGLSSSRLIKTPSDDEDFEQSRRVEFRILLKTDEAISKISLLD
jgi:outer membrane protein OmpA-like peptidoglycan-associated protein